MKYKVVMADPPWSFKVFSAKGKGRSAEAHYDVMSIDDICAMPVKNMVEEDALLFMWITDPMIPYGLKVMNAWGFDFSTVAFYWAKENRKSAGFFTGMGYWTRANPEQCWLGTRKKKPKRLHMDVRKLIVSKLREHSRKPDEVYERIERLVPGPYLEMFSRSSRPGWDTWGNEMGLFDQGPVQTRRFSSNLNSLSS